MAEAATLPVLPKGFTLPHAEGGAGCKLLTLEVQNPGVNVYRAYDLSPSRRCPVCVNREPREAVICRTCGADLAQVRPDNAVIFVHESADPARLQPGPAVHLAGVRHPHLLLPVYAQIVTFTDTEPRTYLLMPERPAPALADLPTPHGVLTVLRWGVQLGRALAHLQAADLLHGAIDLRHVLVRADRAWLACDPAEAPTAYTPSRGRDVQQLARVLLYALSGSDDPAGLATLPPPVRRALESGLAAAAGEGTPAGRFADALASAAEEVRGSAQARSNAAWITDPGRQRLDNEDSLGVLTLDAICAGVRTNAALYVVADGAGGHAAGEAASRAAVEAVTKHLATRPFAAMAGGLLPSAPDLVIQLTTAFAQANSAVRRLRAARDEKLATTLTVLLVAGQQALAAHAGDTRLYRWNSAGLVQVTRDHTLAARLATAMAATDPGVTRSLGRNQLDRALGVADVVEPDIHELDLAPDDVLLLCSDGLHGEISDSQIVEILSCNTDLQSAARALVNAANAAGGRDNITVILFRPCERSALQ